MPVHRTGAIYRKDNRTDFETLNQVPAQSPGDWNDYEIGVENQLYSVFLNGRQVCVFDKFKRTSKGMTLRRIWTPCGCRSEVADRLSTYSNRGATVNSKTLVRIQSLSKYSIVIGLLYRFRLRAAGPGHAVERQRLNAEDHLLMLGICITTRTAICRVTRAGWWQTAGAVRGPTSW